MPALRLVVDPAGRARLYAHGILVPGLKAIVAHPGGDVMLLVDRDEIRIDAPRMPAAEQDLDGRHAYPTDGAA